MNIAVILAGGTGSRLGGTRPKQFLKVAGKTVLEHTVEVFQKNSLIDEIAIVCHPDYIELVKGFMRKNHWTKVRKILNGGQERYESSLIAIRAYDKSAVADMNLIFHDAVRPLVSHRIIVETIQALKQYGAVDVAVPAVDTIIKVDRTKRFIDFIPDRNYLNRGQTPQGFHYAVIRKAYEKALKDPAFKTTDDCGIVRKYLPEIPIFVVPGEERNIKLTYPEDVYLLDKLFQIKNTTISSRIDLSLLKERTLVIFGGNSGIGKAIAIHAQAHGAHVYSFSRSTTRTDITDFENVQKALESVYSIEQHIDFVVNTAAVLNKEPLMHLDLDAVNQLIQVNYNGFINVTMASYEYLKKSKGQLLHFTSSSYLRGRAFYSLYSSSKAAVVNFVQAMAEEWENEEIRINCINPQRTKTPMRVVNFGNEPDATLLQPDTVAKVALSTLLSDFTGEVVDIKVT